MGNLSELLLNLRLVGKENLKKIINYKHNLSLADSPCHDDLYVVSFPKSGSTWMNFLMANIHLKMSNDDRSVNFYNIHNFIPDIHFCRQIRSLPLSFPGFRVMKSHSVYNPSYKNTIYIVRDPRDVLVSYYHFLLGVGNFAGDIKQLIYSPHYGIRAWEKHVRSWAESPVNIRIAFIRYEDLKSKPLDTLKRVYGLFGYDLAPSILKEAIKLSSFKRMKALEEDYGHGGREVAKKFKFMRRGESGGWQNAIADNELNYIQEVAGKWLEKFEYV